MSDRGMKLKQMQRQWGLKAKDISNASGGQLSIDTIRRLGKIGMSDEMLDSMEENIEKARQIKFRSLQVQSKVAG